MEENVRQLLHVSPSKQKDEDKAFHVDKSSDLWAKVLRLKPVKGSETAG